MIAVRRSRIYHSISFRSKVLQGDWKSGVWKSREPWLITDIGQEWAADSCKKMKEIKEIKYRMRGRIVTLYSKVQNPLLNRDFIESWLYWIVTLLNRDFIESWLYWIVTLLNRDVIESWLHRNESWPTHNNCTNTKTKTIKKLRYKKILFKKSFHEMAS